jgi:predicted transglutaminase-like cysteine proteinase
LDDRTGIAAARPAWERSALESLWLSVVKTIPGIGHLVLIVATTRGDIVMETEAISPWQSTDLNDRYERVDAAHSTKPDNTRRASVG